MASQPQSKQIKSEIRQLKAEMKERGIRTVSCFNGGLDDATYRANSRLFQLKVKLDNELRLERAIPDRESERQAFINAPWKG